MRRAVLLSLCLALALGGPLTGVKAAPLSQAAEVLLRFAAVARGENSSALPDWQDGADPCSWSGVTCARGAVTALHLAGAGLSGSLAPELAEMTSLRQIDLAGNALAGPLPVRWARLARLERLYLDGNRLTGTLPATWNMLEGIKYLGLSGNRLSGSLPVAWSSMGQLYLLDLSANNLTGTLPSAWARQRMLIHLALARNALSGSLPREWGRLRSLLQLDASGNVLSGSLPPEWGTLRQVTALDLSRNALEGPLPSTWADLTSLQMLSLRSNQLSGAIPSQWVALASRTYSISLGDNRALCGTVPAPLATKVLAAGSSSKGTSLGSPCSWQADAAALLQLKAAVASAPAGALADWLPEANPCSSDAWTGISCRGGRVIILNLANAGLRLAGSLDALGSLAALQKLLLTGNTLNASLPGSWARLQQLAVADLSGTGVSGTLPPAWADMRSLKQLLLADNNLNGTLPASWAALVNLTTLNLAHNALSGSLPSEWSTMADLSTLDANGNYLSGSLPNSWRDLASLEAVQLANNNLAGAIPASWVRLPSLTLLNLASNVGVCGGQPAWRAGTQVSTDATNVHQSCIMVNTSGTMAGVVLGVTLSVTLASLVAVGALLVYVQRQQVQLQLLQRERSTANFPSFTGKMATVHSFPACEGRTPAERVKTLTIPNPFAEDQAQAGYIQVPMATPQSAVPTEARTPRSALPQEHRSPSPVLGMPSPERHQWQVAAQAVDRGVDLTARRSRQKRLFRSRSEAPTTLAGAAVAGALAEEAAAGGANQQTPQLAPEWSQDDSSLDMLRVHSRIALLPPDGGMV